MTFLEKALEINKKIGINTTESQIMEQLCPSDYGFTEEKEKDCFDIATVCERCWNREMQDTEPSCDDVKDAYEQGLNDGRNEVWEFLDRIEHAIKSSVLIEVFGYSNIGDILDHFKPQEALAKLKAYEEAQRKVEVGDVIESTIHEDMDCGVVVKITDNRVNVVHKDGCLSAMMPIRFIKKTGKHIDIKSILESIGE